MPKDTPCIECGFELWIPLKKFSKTTLGLYNDARFPGRSILKLDDHYDQLDEVPETLLKEFWKDINTASKALKNTTRSERINIAILGNRESHVHAHLIPRYSLVDILPALKGRGFPARQC